MALVITIIVLIILAGVSINAVMNQGLITNAKDASGKYSKEKSLEELALTNLEGIMAVENLKEVKAGEYTEAENCKYIEGGKTAVIPAGFTVSNIEGENTISGGLVIYSEEVTDWTTAQTTHNQYVWIPVENPSDMYGILESGIDGIEGKKFGKLYFGYMQASSGYMSTDPNSHMNWPLEEKYSALWNREPAYLYDSDYADASKYNTDGTNTLITQDGLVEAFNDMVTSVEKYKGFYIGRYELTGTVSAPTIYKDVTPIVDTTWYDFYTACENLETGNTNAGDKVETTIVWGCQWDQAVKTILKVEDFSDFLTNAKEYGVYSDSKITTLGATGRMSAAYNIYDMGGNAYDWTFEALSDVFRYFRGGSYNESSTNCPAIHRYSINPSGQNTSLGCRAQLYIK